MDIKVTAKLEYDQEKIESYLKKIKWIIHKVDEKQGLESLARADLYLEGENLILSYGSRQFMMTEEEVHKKICENNLNFFPLWGIEF